MKRPMVIEAYMTHNRTPFITEILKDGRTRKIGRAQTFSETREQPENR